MRLNDFLIRQAVVQARTNYRNTTRGGTSLHVANYLQGGKQWDALAEYLGSFNSFEDLDKPLKETP